MVNFRLSGKTSLLKLKLEHPMHLDDDVRYYLALTGFYCDNYFYNITEEACMMFDTPDHLSCSLPKGYYKSGSVIKAIKDYMLKKKIVTSVEESEKFIFRTVRNKIIIESPVKFHMNNSMRRYLGFNEIDEIVYENKYTAENMAHFRAFNILEIHCDLVEFSLVNHNVHAHKHKETSILYHLDPKEHGDKIVKLPHVFDYVPLKRGLKTISEVNIALTDENNNLIQNASPSYYVYLKLVRESEI